MYFGFIFAALGGKIIAVIIRTGEQQGFRAASAILISVSIAITAISIPQYLPHRINSSEILALLYFLVMLTVINAPFDWLALGITRGLLRRGLERGGAWPLVLGLADLAVSIALLLGLAVAVLWATELFNHSTVLGGLKVVVAPSKLLPALATAPFAPEHLWLIAMLFSTQVPALLNLIFGTFCLLRGLPAINRWLARDLPVAGEIPFWRALKLSSVWSAQLGLAVFVGLAGFYLLFFDGLVWLLDAVFGTTLIGILKSVSIAGWLAG